MLVQCIASMLYSEKEAYKMSTIIANLFDNYYETVSIILFGIGFSALLLNKNMIKKIMGFNIMDTAVYLFLASKGYIESGIAPIIMDPADYADIVYVNPLPSGLVLTGIVVSVSVTAVMLSLTIRLYRRYHSIDIDEIVMNMRKEAN